MDVFPVPQLSSGAVSKARYFGCALLSDCLNYCSVGAMRAHPVEVMRTLLWLELVSGEESEAVAVNADVWAWLPD